MARLCAVLAQSESYQKESLARDGPWVALVEEGIWSVMWAMGETVWGPASVKENMKSGSGFCET